jgi:glycosyltransferase involved in cell wall biosynthesis
MQGQDAKAGNKTFKWIRPRASQLVAISDFIADEFNRNYSIRPAHVVPVSIDITLFPEGHYERTIDVMGTGTLMALKRYGLFVSIIKSLAAQVPGLNVIHCGGGIDKEKLLKQISDSNLQETISLLGEVPHQKVLELMAQTKVFLHTSEYEGFGAVCVEALAAGAHVVSFVKPMKQPISQWHIVNTQEEAEQKLLELLQNKSLTHEKVIPFPAAESCRKIMALYQ